MSIFAKRSKTFLTRLKLYSVLLLAILVVEIQFKTISEIEVGLISYEET